MFYAENVHCLGRCRRAGLTPSLCTAEHVSLSPLHAVITLSKWWGPPRFSRDEKHKKNALLTIRVTAGFIPLIFTRTPAPSAPGSVRLNHCSPFVPSPSTLRTSPSALTPSSVTVTVSDSVTPFFSRYNTTSSTLNISNAHLNRASAQSIN